MAETSPSTRAAPISRERAEAVLEAVCRGCGTAYDSATGRRESQRLIGASDGSHRTAVESWMRALGNLGVRALGRIAPLRDAARWCLAGMPVLMFGRGSNVVLLERQGGAWTATCDGATARAVTIADLARELQVEATSEIHCLLLEPAASCSAVRASGGGADRGGTATGHDRHRPTPFQRLLGLMSSERRDLRTVLVFSFAIGALTLAIPLAVETLVNVVAFGNTLQPVVILSVLLFAGLSFSALLQAVQTYIVELLQRRVFLRVVNDLAHRIPRVRADAFDGKHGPELVNRFFDVLTVQKVGSGLLLDGLAIVLQAGVGLAVLGLYHPVLLTFDVALLLVLAFILFVLGRGAVRTAIAESLAKYEIAAWLEELARHRMTFKLAGGAELAHDRADDLARGYLDARRRHFAIVFRQLTSGYFLQAVVSTLLLGVGGFLVIDNQLSLGQLVAANIIVTVVVGSFAKLGKHIEGYYDLLAACDKLGHLIDLPLEAQGGEPAPRVHGPGRIAFADAVHLQPHGGGFDRLSFVVEPGERVAILGPAGSGASALTDVLFGLRELQAGAATLDGVNIRDLDRADLRRHIACVKDFEVLDATILENVRMGRPVGVAEAADLLESVGVLEEIQRFTDGLQTELSNGSPLAARQIRLLMLARALAGRPRVLVLDETLDHLDETALEKLKRRWFAEARPWSAIVLTTRPTIAGWCDRTIRLPEPNVAGGSSHVTHV